MHEEPDRPLRRIGPEGSARAAYHHGDLRNALLEAGDGGYGVLRECIAATDRAAGGDGALTGEKVVLAHTLVHGFGTLVLENTQFHAQLRAAPSVAVAFLARLLRLARPAFESTQVSAPD